MAKFLSLKFIVAFLLVLLALVFTFSVQRLHFSDQVTQLAPHDSTLSRVSNILVNSSLLDKIVVSVKLDSANSDALTLVAQQLSDSLDRILKSHSGFHLRPAVTPEQMNEVMDFMFLNLPVYLDSSDWIELDTLLKPENIDRHFASMYQALMSPASAGIKRFFMRDPLQLNRFGSEKLKQLRPNTSIDLLNGFPYSVNHATILLFIENDHKPSTAEVNLLVKDLNSIQTQLELHNQAQTKANIDFFGAPLVAAGNQNQIVKDVMLTVSLALISLLLLFIYYFKAKRAGFILILPTILAAFSALGIMSFFTHEISLISIGIASVLLGISVDFAIHFYNHYRHTLSITKTRKELWQSILMSSATTAAAFFSLASLHSVAMSQLGLFLGISILLSAGFTLFVLPIFLPKTPRTIQSRNFVDALAGYDLSRNKIIVVVVVLVSGAFVVLWPQPHFERQLDSSNFMSPELKASEQNLNAITGLDSSRNMLLVGNGSNLDEVLSQFERRQKDLDRLQNQGKLNYYLQQFKLLPSKKLQYQRIARWKAFWTPEKRSDLEANLNRNYAKYGFNPQIFTSFPDWLKGDFQVHEPEQNPIYGLFVKDFVIKSPQQVQLLTQINVPKNYEMQQGVVEVLTQGSFFVADARRYAHELMNHLNDAFNKLAWWSLLLVFVILWVGFGRIELALISFTPIAFAWVWMLNFMHFLGLEFNIFNVIIISFVFGLGIDYSIFYLQSLIQQHRIGTQNEKQVRSSIFLSVLTTILGIGVLIFAKHPALKSIAMVSITSIFTIIVLTLVLIPVAFRWLVEWKGNKRFQPITFQDFILSLVFFTVYVTGSLTMTLLVPFFLLFPAPKKTKKRVFRYLIRFFSAHIFLHPTISIRILNEYKEKFTTPSIVIANHQSVIDIMLMLLLSPKILIVTNERVWKHWLWGAILRYADYYPAFSGYDQMLSKLKKSVEDGYSLMIFPEGTRSPDGEIKRFHKGAFYLAQELNIPILPIVLHGVNFSLSKKEFFLFSGNITMKILKPIELQALPFDQGLQQVAKEMTYFYRNQLAQMKQEYGTIYFHAKHLKRAFIYKGPVLEWYFKIKLRMEKSYKIFDSQIPLKAEILDLGCGYGFLSLMLALRSGDRKINAFDFDAEKIQTAQNVSLRPRNLQFAVADLQSFDVPKADVILLLDTLHYLTKEAQENNLIQCFKALNTGGQLWVRDGNTEMESLHKNTQNTEKWSTGIGFNKAKYKDMNFVSESWLIQMAQEHGMELTLIEQSKKLSNRLYLIQVKTS